MKDLVTWLTARLDEDEAAAKAAVGRAVWVENSGEWIEGFGSAAHPRLIFAVGVDGDALTQVADLSMAWHRDERQAHIIRHDPARVLADVAAKRAIVDAVESWPHVVNRDAWHWCPMAPETRAEFPEDIEDRCTCGRDRRALAILGPLAYAYHVAGAEGWREEWRP